MKRIMRLILIVLAVVLAGCGIGQGVPPAEDIEQGFLSQTDFDKVQVINGFQVNISVGRGA